MPSGPERAALATALGLAGLPLADVAMLTRSRHTDAAACAGAGDAQAQACKWFHMPQVLVPLFRILMAGVSICADENRRRHDPLTHLMTVQTRHHVSVKIRRAYQGRHRLPKRQHR
jgi:hypothetical protein